MCTIICQLGHAAKGRVNFQRGKLYSSNLNENFPINTVLLVYKGGLPLPSFLPLIYFLFYVLCSSCPLFGHYMIPYMVTIRDHAESKRLAWYVANACIS